MPQDRARGEGPMRPAMGPERVFLLTLLTMLAFAANSVLARLALIDGAIDPFGFTAVRLGSGALVLAVFLRAPAGQAAGWRPWSALALLAYALPFSLAYVSLEASVGALLLFGAVQVTMIGAGLLRGERMGPLRILGGLMAIAGFLVLVRPGLSAPDPAGAALMTLAGIAWGLYSLAGRKAARPQLATARNFLLAAPIPLLLYLLRLPSLPAVEPQGWILAIASGAITSALGYVLWYAALAGHSRTSAALVQLSVPLIAAAGGALLLGETIGMRFVVATILTLGGIAVAILSGSRAEPISARG